MNDMSSILAISLISLIISAGILYLIIKWAVSEALKDTNKQLHIQNRIEIYKLKQNGAVKETIDELTY